MTKEPQRIFEKEARQPARKDGVNVALCAVGLALLAGGGAYAYVQDREADRRRGLEAGADHYLAKSGFHDEALLRAVVDLIGEATS